MHIVFLVIGIVLLMSAIYFFRLMRRDIALK
jgi:hypothetical protein